MADDSHAADTQAADTHADRDPLGAPDGPLRDFAR